MSRCQAIGRSIDRLASLSGAANRRALAARHRRALLAELLPVPMKGRVDQQIAAFCLLLASDMDAGGGPSPVMLRTPEPSPLRFTGAAASPSLPVSPPLPFPPLCPDQFRRSSSPLSFPSRSALLVPGSSVLSVRALRGVSPFRSAVAFILRPADPLGPWTLRRPGFVTPVDTGRDGNGRGVPGGRDKGGDHLLSGPSPREPSRPAKSQGP